MVWLPPNRIITSVTFILFVCALVGTVHADSVTPPGGITICGYVTYANEIGIWWFNPNEPDFAGVQMWLDDQYLGTSKPADHFHNAYSAVIGTHTFSTHTFDNSGNVNSTWINLTFLTKEYPGCTENWTCDTCSLPLIPVAAFSANPTYGTVPLAVQFTDTSTNAPTGWNWSFGDGNYSTLQSPAHTYTSAGTYTVSLTASNAAGTSIATKTGYIDVTSHAIPPTASFTGIPTTGTVPLAVQFTDLSNGSPVTWNWSFGDGSSSTTRNPLHTYPVNGTYTVSLEVTNAAGSNTAIRADYITASASPGVIPTPVSGDSDSDSTRFVPSTSASTETIVKAGERITVPFPGNLQADNSVPVVVTGISLVPSVDIQGVMVSAEHATMGSTTTISGYPPAYYLDINLYWIREDAVREGEIRFSADEGWLKDQGIAPTDLVMTRYHDNGWSELPTRMEQYSNGRYYYAATTSGFSYFAVTRKGAGAPTTTPTLVSRVTITQQIKTEFTTGTTTGPVTPVLRTKPVTATTTVPPVAPVISPEFPAIWIIFGAAGITAFVLTITFVRRWWIQRQNPALFRKYD